MRVHYLQHVPFEGIGSMEPFLIDGGHRVSSTRLYLRATLPPIDAFDWLIVMGGPMGVGDEGRYKWLAREKAFIKAVVESGKIVLGICLGAQLIAEALGAAVTKNRCREIGWFPHQNRRGRPKAPCWGGCSRRPSMSSIGMAIRSLSRVPASGWPRARSAPIRASSSTTASSGYNFTWKPPPNRPKP